MAFRIYLTKAAAKDLAAVPKKSLQHIDTTIRSLANNLGFAVGGRAVHCQNLQIAVEFNESDLERYQQFEGVQPDVLERINSNPKKLEG